MKKTSLFSIALFAGLGALAWEPADSVDILAYAPINADGGMHLAWRESANQPWQSIGDYSFVSSDFGPWGSHKKMHSPVLSRQGDQWILTWVADPDGLVVAQAKSADLLYWKPQTYAMGAHHGGASVYLVDGKAVSGNQTKLSIDELKSIQTYVANRKKLAELYDEQAKDDPTRFAGLEKVAYSITPASSKGKPISDMLIGIFIEDINYAADGGMYAELVQNRDFEYQPSDRGNDKKWNSLTAWSFPSYAMGSYEIKTDSPIHPNNPHYLAVDAVKGFTIINSGFDGIALKKGEKYDISFLAKGDFHISAVLRGKDNKASKTCELSGNASSWESFSGVLEWPFADCDNATLVLRVDDKSTFDIDMVSLFPQNTFHGRANGLRPDLAQTLADMRPRFVRFPGGCVAHGDGIDNIYDWKGSVGPLEARKPLRNLWGYHQTRGLGYYEYFQFCEDIGAEPLPVLAAGVPCQNSGTAAHHSHDAITTRGQQCGIPMEEMGAYIQDVLDLIEWANGPADSQWGSLRAQAGHPEPFNLKYIGIGNEDMITEVFEERFKMIYDAVRAAHPEVEVVGTVGPFYEGTDYEEGWRLARELDIPYVDEHYYVPPGWMIYNQDFYDGYQRPGTKVYLGEYAAHLPGRPSNVETALAEALYLTSVERNADVVAMTSYAPLLSKDNHTQWRPDLIYFNNTEVRPSVDYYVQMLYGNNSGDSYIPAATKISTECEKAAARVASSIVYDSASKQYIIKIVNMLPVEVDLNANLGALKIKKGTAGTITTLSGEPADTGARPEAAPFAMPAGGKINRTLPPYSFTVIRL